MTQPIDKILKIIYDSTTDIIHIYWDCIENENSVTPKLYSHGDTKKIKKNIGGNCDNIKNITQSETFFRDLVKIEIDGDIKSCNYIKKQTLYNTVENVLILQNYIECINKQNFPILSSYHNVEIKKIELIEFETIDVLIIERDKQYNICLSIKDKSEKNKKTLISELSSIINVM